MKRTIKNPHWINNARSILSAEFHYDDGRVVEATISESDGNNPDLREIMENFSKEELEKNTLNKIRKINNEREAEKQKKEAEAQRKQQEELFAVKLKIFEIDRIKNSTNRTLKSAIRRSKSDLEAQAYAAALLLAEINSESAASTDTPEAPQE